EVDLVPHGGNDGDARARDRARDHLLVERPEVLERPPAASDDDDVETAEPVQVRDSRRDLARGPVALHADRPHDDAAERPALAEDGPHVVDRRAPERGDDADRAWKPGKRPLPLRREQPFRAEA